MAQGGIAMKMKLGRLLLPLALTGALAVGAPPAENARLALMRADAAAGGVFENQRIVLTVAVTPLAVPEVAESATLRLWPGPHAPASDRAGLITPRRLGGFLIGAEVPPEPLAALFAGNRDGDLNIIDMVSLTDRIANGGRLE